MKLTAKKAKERELLIWNYCKEHPVFSIDHLPYAIKKLIKNYPNKSPLCAFFRPSINVRGSCRNCPIFKPHTSTLSCAYYSAWVSAKTPQARIKAAEVLASLLLAWEAPDDEA